MATSTIYLIAGVPDYQKRGRAVIYLDESWRVADVPQWTKERDWLVSRVPRLWAETVMDVGAQV